MNITCTTAEAATRVTGVLVGYGLSADQGFFRTGPVENDQNIYIRIGIRLPEKTLAAIRMLVRRITGASIQA